MKQIHRFAGASIGAIVATLYSIGLNSYDVEKVMSVNLLHLVNGNYFVFKTFLKDCACISIRARKLT
jgi:predicted acylesterase/phospholipase RssA